MQCPRCQQENPAGARFCNSCGAGLELTCPSCRHSNPAGSQFCNRCGASLGATPTPAGPRFASPESYTPKHLAEKILTSRAALEGERKHVTVLFADLKGSMELLADRDPEEARRILDPVLAHMMDAVHRYEGTVNQVMGDGIMALFGAPLAHEDHAVRACYAALRMQQSVAQYAEGVFRAHGVPLQIRVGLNSGEVVVRAIGSDLHMDYTAVGQTTHLAARMEQMATPGTILLAPATLQFAEGYVHVVARGPVAVKGLPTPMEIYALTGASTQRSRLHVAAARGLTRFVGRDAELEQIRRALGLAHDGRGQLVAIVGEPGVGKSRLVYEFTHSHRTQDWLVLEAGSLSYGKASSYLPVIDLLRGYFKVNERETHRDIREKVTGKLLTLDRALEPTLPALLALLDVPVEDAHWQALDPAQRRQRTLDAVKRLLLRESLNQPLLVVFEDLHWIDAETQALLDSLLESLPTARLLLLVNYRPEYQHGWTSKTYYTQLRLDALPPASVGDLLQALLGDDPTLEPLKPLLVRRGNPLFIEESIRTLVETGALAGERCAYRLTRPIQSIEVPATVQVILAARIDRLAEEYKHLLQMASVIGKDVPFVLLHAIAELSEDVVQRGLTHLQGAEFLYETRLFPDAEYTFKHALTHEVTYGTLLQERRKALHARIVGAIERCYRNRLTEHLERLAHHAVRGEIWEQAVTYLRQAGAKAFARSANREAVTFFEQALTALAHLPETRETLEQAIDVRFDLRTALFPLGHLERIFAYLREAEGFAKALDDPGRLGRVSVYMGHYFWVTGSSAQARTFAHSAQNIGETLDNLSLEVGGNFYLGTSYHDLGDYPQAEVFFRKVMHALQDGLSRERCGLTGFPAVMSRWFLGECLAERGAFEEGLRHAQEGVRLAEAMDHAYSLALACGGLGYVYDAMSELDSAVRVLERALSISRDWSLAAPFAIIAPRLGSVYARSGRVAEGGALLRQGVADLETIGLGYAIHAEAIMRLGETSMLAGQLDDAFAYAERALTLARERGQRGVEAKVSHLLGEIASHRDPSAAGAAAGHYRQAMTLARELQARPLLAQCHRGLGKLDQRTGKSERAGEHVVAAMTMYREMGMTYWLEQAEAEMRELG
jgi:class 3 adenylate cyclase/tetratricopeptide (TPR) repeat protein